MPILMKKLVFLFAFGAVMGIKSYSQIIFENGYFIDENNQKIDCLIKNIDWKDNPTDFEYKLSPSSGIQRADAMTVKEFGVNNGSRYISASVKIDRSGDNVNELTPGRNPIFHEEQLFLKVLIEGKASLFLYESKNLTRFFYQTNDSGISQLIYKRYTINGDIRENNYYKQQIFNDLKYENSTLNDVKNINYNRKDLERFFLKYNGGIDSDRVKYNKTKKRDFFYLTIRPGLNISNLSIHNPTGTWDIDFDPKFAFRLGAETELILPYNKNKWSILIEPAYQYFKSEKSKEASNVSGGVLFTKVNYQSIELPVGFRYYSFLNNESKVFVDVLFVLDFSFNSSIKYTRPDETLLFDSMDINSRNNLAFGIGYNYKGRYSLEVRYQTGRELLNDYPYWDAIYKTLSLTFGYTLF